MGKVGTLAAMNSKLLCCAVFLTFATALVAGPKLKPIFNGKVIKRFSPSVKPDAPEVIAAIESALKK